MAFAIEISEVGPPEYPVLQTLRDTIFNEFGHVSHSSIAEQFEGRVDLLLLIAHLEGNPLGFATGYRSSPQVFYLNYLGLLPAYRRQSLGRQLLLRQETFAKSRGYLQMQFNTFNHFPGMIRLGLASGYTPAGVEQHAGSEWDLAIRFDKVLNPIAQQPGATTKRIAAEGDEVRVAADDVLNLVELLEKNYRIVGMMRLAGQRQPQLLLKRAIQERS